MMIAIELNAAQSEQLKAIAASMGVPAEELARSAVTDLIGGDAADFEAAARVGCADEGSASVAIDVLRTSAHPVGYSTFP